MRHHSLLVLGLFVCACASERPAASSAQDIIGGAVSSDDHAVVLIDLPDGLCTGTLVAREVVLTAAHCIARAIARGDTASGTVSFGAGTAGSPAFATRRIVDMVAHRRFDLARFDRFDIGLVRIEPAPAEVAPVPLGLGLSAPAPGQVVRAVGFGVTSGVAQTGAGIRRTVDVPVTAVTAEHLLVGDAGAGTCVGDSGGPTLLGVGGVERAIAVTSFGVVGCAGDARHTRVDVHRDFIAEVLAAWDGPCRLDGACVTAGCGAFADPDCDPCGFDGACAAGCPRVDLDCPLSAVEGEACGVADDCESRLCVPAPEDERVRYCSAPCADASECPAPLGACVLGVCRFEGVTPTVQGAPCEVGGDCRGGFCDPAAGICAEPCVQFSVCEAPFECLDVDGTVACTLPESAGCAVGAPPGSGGGAGGGPVPALLGLLALAVLARRGRGRARRAR